MHWYVFINQLWNLFRETGAKLNQQTSTSLIFLDNCVGEGGSCFHIDCRQLISKQVFFLTFLLYSDILQT